MNDLPNESTEPSAVRTPAGLIWLAAAESLLIGIGSLIRWLSPMKEPPYRLLNWPATPDLVGLGFGLLVGFLLFLNYLAVERLDWKPVIRIRELLRKLLREALVKSSLAHLFIVALSAGLCEEYLFRGVLEARLGFWASNLMFALLHPHTFLYFILVFGIGGIMSASVSFTGSLWTAIAAHTLYDFTVLWKITNQCRKEHQTT
ncbi:MAG: CPBP family intramembrane metalloprotease [Planctomycetaceae bacterium]|nr:CPBP family intramembrane metalloprotease [Planctomycetaceae bacterium]